jgi:hypothetical protein
MDGKDCDCSQAFALRLQALNFKDERSHQLSLSGQRRTLLRFQSEQATGHAVIIFSCRQHHLEINERSNAGCYLGSIKHGRDGKFLIYLQVKNIVSDRKSGSLIRSIVW